jgi:hypothetical protein
MLKIFEIDTETQMPVLIAEARTITVYKDIIEADPSSDKIIAMKELAYVYWSSVFDSSYDCYDELEKKLKIKNDVGLPEDWRPSELVKAACDFYTESQKTLSWKYMNSTKSAVDSISEYLLNINLDEKDRKGMLVHDVVKVKNTIKEMPEMVKSLNSIKQMVAEELKEEIGNRAGRRTNKFNK